MKGMSFSKKDKFIFGVEQANKRDNHIPTNPWERLNENEVLFKKIFG